MSKTQLFTTLVLVFAAEKAAGKSLLCNKEQSRCTTDSTSLTIGDDVGIFNDDGELVAVGKVNSMRGERRTVTIKKRYGAIHKGYQLSLLTTKPSADDFADRYTLYKEPATFSVGASLGLATSNIGQGSPATEMSIFGSMRKWRGVQLVARGSYMAIEGEVSRYSDLYGIETQPISVSGYGLLGGVAYGLRENKTISFRGELGLGFMFISANVDGDASVVSGQGYDTRISNGFGPYLRGSVGTMWNLSKWHFHLDIAQSFVHGSLASTIVVGAIMDIR